MVSDLPMAMGSLGESKFLFNIKIHDCVIQVDRHVSVVGFSGIQSKQD